MKRLLLVVALLIPSHAMASDPACGGWLCAVVGFAAPGCEPAKAEMFKRMLEGKSPLPSFSSCSVDGSNPNNTDMRYGTAILMGSADPETGSRIRIGGFCNFRDSGAEEPAGCVATLRTMQMVQGTAQQPTESMMIYDRGDSSRIWIRDNLTGDIMSVEAYSQLLVDRAN